MPSYLFWLFSTVMLLGGVSVVAFRNPVSSALSVVTCFVGLAGLFIGLSAFFVGIIQILVYTGAVMVLFLFIIMLLDLKHEEKRTTSMVPIILGFSLVLAFLVQLLGVLSKNPDSSAVALRRETLSDVHIIGQTLFTEYNFPLQLVGVLLLVATVGVVVLSKRQAE